MIKQPDLVIVEWGDAWAGNKWHPISKIITEDDSLIVFSVGWKVLDNEACIKLAASISPDNESASNYCSIPRAMIRKVKVIRKSE